MFIKFDNSEDAFFPDNETVQLLNEVEDEYQASIDFIRFIDRIDSGDLYKNSTWHQLAVLEAILIEDENLNQYQYPLFGIQAHSGMASSAMQWQMYQDPVNAQVWISNLESSISEVMGSNNSTLQTALNSLNSSVQSIPSPGMMSASKC